jgi:GMP synthase (glutamine-hydrolysing)
MRESTDAPHILLIQARQPDDPILEHEFECFVARTRFSPEAFTAVNMATESVSEELLQQVDLVTVGGAGDFSVVERGFDWHDELLGVMEQVVDRELPMFASCFGFQALVQVYGGELESLPECAEIGTHTVELTDEGREDAFFSHLPERFNAQLGHQDSVTELPGGLTRLAFSDNCPVQAVRVPGKPIYATQFHPELSADENIDRYVRYLQNYKQTDESREEALERAERIHSPSPEANELFRRFIDHVFGDEWAAE